MSRWVWSMGGTGLVLAGVTSAWLHRPVELASPAPEPREGSALAKPAPPPLTGPAATVPPEASLPRSLAPSPPAPAEVATAQRLARRPPSETRVRVVKALREEHPTPGARRDAVLAELAATGASTEAWTEQARAALDTWRARVEADVLPVRAEPPRCFSAGCVARVTFPDAASYEASFQRTAELRLGTGSAHLQLPPERLPSGEVAASWVVLRPDAP